MHNTKNGFEKIEAVTFDAYGTLLHVDRVIERLRDELSKIGITTPFEAVQNAFITEVGYYKAHHLEAKDLDRLLNLRHRCAEVLFDKLAEQGYACEVSPEKKLAVLIEGIHFKLYEDVLLVLEWCKSKGLMTGVISNWDCSLPEILNDRLDRHRFDVIMVSAIEGINKSDPAMFYRAAERLGLSPSRILHVGDEMENDLHSPQKAGWNAVLLDREGHRKGIEGPSIRSLTDLPSTIEEMLYHRP